METESPRGRIALMKGLQEGRIEASKRVVSHWDLCLGCRACEAACPSGVPYGRLIEGVREEISEQGKASWRHRLVSAVLLRGLLPRLWALRWLVRMLRWYQRLGLQSLLRRSRVLKVLPGSLDKLEGQTPMIPGQFFSASSHVYPATGTKRMRVGLLAGCVMPLVQGPTMESAVRVLQRNGCEVVAPPNQGCCGALNLAQRRRGRRAQNGPQKRRRFSSGGSRTGRRGVGGLRLRHEGVRTSAEGRRRLFREGKALGGDDGGHHGVSGVAAAGTATVVAWTCGSPTRTRAI